MIGVPLEFSGLDFVCVCIIVCVLQHFCNTHAHNFDDARLASFRYGAPAAKWACVRPETIPTICPDILF